MRTYIILTLGIFAQATGNVFLSKEMKHIALAVQAIDSSFLVLFFSAFENPVVWMGTGLLIISFLLFVAALSLADLSFVLPVVSIEVIVNVAFANYFLNEPVSLLRWMGTMLISTGVILVVRSEKQTAKHRKRQETPYVKSR
jgi:drug/metabolite transporter (DMT)-like permease